MSPLNQCRHCQTPLSTEETPDRLCGECCWFANDYRRYDDLRAEGHGAYQAKLMCGLTDPPNPNEE